MRKTARTHAETPWISAKRLCRLNTRQVAMARRLGLNPKKLPDLRPSIQQRCKRPVGQFIEELYGKRFGSSPPDCEPLAGAPSCMPAATQDDAPASVQPVDRRLGDLVCHLTNLAEDLQRWLVHGTIDGGVVTHVAQDLREIASALETGASVDPVPQTPLPPSRTPPRQEGEAPSFDDDVPF